jgi:hypothetical protein
MLAYLVLAALFFVFSPGTFLSLPRGGSKYVVALVHTALFVAAFTAVQYVNGDLDDDTKEGFAFFMNSYNSRLNGGRR